MQVSVRISQIKLSSLSLFLILLQFIITLIDAASSAKLQRISSRQVRNFEASARPEVNAVIPSPLASNFEASEASMLAAESQINDIVRNNAQIKKIASTSSNSRQQVEVRDSKAVPVYVSPFVRPRNANLAPLAATNNAAASMTNANANGQNDRVESIRAYDDAHNSYESPVSESKMTNYAAPSDLKTSASYGKFNSIF